MSLFSKECNLLQIGTRFPFLPSFLYIFCAQYYYVSSMLNIGYMYMLQYEQYKKFAFS